MALMHAPKASSPTNPSHPDLVWREQIDDGRHAVRDGRWAAEAQRQPDGSVILVVYDSWRDFASAGWREIPATDHLPPDQLRDAALVLIDGRSEPIVQELPSDLRHPEQDRQIPSAPIIEVAFAELRRIAAYRATELHRFLSWAHVCESSAVTALRLRDRPDIARARSIFDHFDDTWWATVVYTCFDSIRGAERVAPEFRRPRSRSEAAELLSRVQFVRGDIGGHRIQPGHKGARIALTSACEYSRAFREILLDGGSSFDVRYHALLDIQAPQWKRTTCFDLLLRSGQLAVNGRSYEPEIAYLAGSQGPRSGFEVLFGVAVNNRNVAWCEGVLQAWNKHWQDVAAIARFAGWEGAAYGSGDLENALCVYQEPLRRGWPNPACPYETRA